MTISSTYLSDLSRVRVSMTSIPSDTDYVRVERSTDGINWTTVRGGNTLAVVSGAAQIDDYEFDANKLNTYRATYVDSAAISWIGSSGPFSGNNASLAVAYNGSTVTNDLILLYATIRNTAATVNTPSGWTKLIDMGNACVFGKYQDGAAAPTVTFSGGAAGDDTTAQTTTFRNVGLTPVNTATQTNASAQNLAVPALGLPVAPTFVIALGWKQDDWSSAPTIPGYTNELGQVAATAGNDAGHVWWVKQRTGTSPEGTNTFTITGGAAAVSKSAMAAFAQRSFISQESTTITPTLTSYWLKNLGRPALNMAVEITECSEITRAARTGLFDVRGRNNQVAVTDVQSSRRFTIEIDVKGYSNVTDWDNRLSMGEPLFLQGPDAANSFVPTCYVVTGDVTVRQDAKGLDSCTYVIPLVEVAKPGSAVYGSTYVWSDVYTQYASWTDVIAGVTTWSNLMDKVSNSIVIVP